MFGIGLRAEHYSYLEARPKTSLDWFEALSENYMDTLGRPLEMLELIRRDYPVALHGVGLSIASAKGPNTEYLKKLNQLINRVDPFLVSDHCCWTRSSTHNLHDLLPFPMRQDFLDLVVQNVNIVQEFLKREILLENVSSYLSLKDSVYTEAEFLAEVVKKTGCFLLLDVNNVYVSAKNHNFCAYEFLDKIPFHNVRQIHLAGHIDRGSFLFDTHSETVCQEVWNLYEYIVPKILKTTAVMVEWDEDIPDFKKVEQEVLIAKEKWLKINEKLRHEHPEPSNTVC